MASDEDMSHTSSALRVRDVMNTKTARIHLGRPMALAAEILVLTQASDLIVIDDDDRFVGVLPEGDLLHAIMPDFDGLMESGASLTRGFEVFLSSGSSYADQPIDSLVIRGSIMLRPDDELLKAATVMITKGIRRLAVVDGERFVGSVSRADICWGILVEQPSRQHAANRTE
ncbi:CBS domain-containing protein [Nocardioides immobilis]|uniref:CBS domain-containing protein n=1 Tax=Nocardioides immobilis TaxID=2049295 RepID=A0A417Y0C6_9ACTN|nr:CBS domain-containing protein [Nocardioides immobilis]RHW26102.1 CBS domain-containing protein [Nocardioides immobilis]